MEINQTKGKYVSYNNFQEWEDLYYKLVSATILQKIVRKTVQKTFAPNAGGKWKPEGEDLAPNGFGCNTNGGIKAWPGTVKPSMRGTT